jgi:hypothetical protein
MRVTNGEHNRDIVSVSLLSRYSPEIRMIVSPLERVIDFHEEIYILGSAYQIDEYYLEPTKALAYSYNYFEMSSPKESHRVNEVEDFLAFNQCFLKEKIVSERDWRRLQVRREKYMKVAKF